MDDSGVVELIGARERIRYALHPGDTADFVILLNGDSAFTRLIGMPWVPTASTTVCRGTRSTTRAIWCPRWSASPRPPVSASSSAHTSTCTTACAPPHSTEGQNSRIVFTEIDHNYVNPVSDRHVAAIEHALSGLPQWATEQARGGYRNAYAVFNEYMTFGVFLLYAQEKLPPKDFTALRTSVVRRMENGRGFPRFGAFQTMLEQVYAASPTKDIPAMYPAVIAGCEGLLK